MTVANRFPFEIQWERVRETILAAGDEALLEVESNRRLFRGWLKGRHGEWMVPRSAFDIVDLGDLVGSLCVYDRDDARDDYLCRVFGGRVADDTGMDMTGHYVSELPLRLRQVVRAQYDQALALRRPVMGVWRATQVELWEPSLREEFQFLHETLILPVTRGGRAIDCFITHVARAACDLRERRLRQPGPERRSRIAARCCHRRGAVALSAPCRRPPAPTTSFSATSGTSPCRRRP